MKKYWVLAFALLGLDLITKYLCAEFLSPMQFGPYPFGGVPIFEAGGVTASLNQVRNPGAAWGILQGYSGLLALARFVCAGILLYSRSKNLSYVLIAVGAFGNGIDYLVYGQVIDFIYFTFWGYSFPVFNLADSCISIGAFLLFFTSRRKAGALSS